MFHLSMDIFNGRSIASSLSNQTAWSVTKVVHFFIALLIVSQPFANYIRRFKYIKSIKKYLRNISAEDDLYLSTPDVFLLNLDLK